MKFWTNSFVFLTVCCKVFLTVFLYSIYLFLPNGGNITELPLRPIVSNIGTASYFLSKYLAKLLSPLSQSEYTVKNTKEFVQDFKRLYVSKDNYKLVLFDVSSLFTNVPSDYTIDVILRRIYTEREIKTNITKKELKDLLILLIVYSDINIDDS